MGDFNGDGIPDLAVAPAYDEGSSEVLLGNGDGTFTNAGGILENDNNTVTSNAIAAADFNGDGNLDLVETCASSNEGPCKMCIRDRCCCECAVPVAQEHGDAASEDDQVRDSVAIEVSGQDSVTAVL